MMIKPEITIQIKSEKVLKRLIDNTNHYKNQLGFKYNFSYFNSQMLEWRETKHKLFEQDFVNVFSRFITIDNMTRQGSRRWIWERWMYKIISR